MLAGAGLGEESGEGVILRLGSVHCRQSSIRLQKQFVDYHLKSRNFHLKAMLHAVELPAGIAHLDTGLANVDRDAFPHDAGLRQGWLVCNWLGIRYCLN